MAIAPHGRLRLVRLSRNRRSSLCASGWRSGAAEQVALACGDAESQHGLEFGCGLDPLGGDARTDVTGERGDAGSEGGPGGVAVDAMDQDAVELDDVGCELHEMGEAG